MKDFTVEEVEVALKHLTNGKSVDVDGVLPKFFKHMGIKSKFWLARFFQQ